MVMLLMFLSVFAVVLWGGALFMGIHCAYTGFLFKDTDVLKKAQSVSYDEAAEALEEEILSY